MHLGKGRSEWNPSVFSDGAMLLELAINNGPAIRASKGLLSAHLNVSIGTEETDTSTILLNSIDESGEPNTAYSTWNAGDLSIGDKVEIRLLFDGEVDAPTEVQRSLESPHNLFSEWNKLGSFCLRSVRRRGIDGRIATSARRGTARRACRIGRLCR